MNIQCPSCQRLLQVSEQFAGQLMKCPLCQGTFTLPGLPAEPAVPAAPSTQPAPGATPGPSAASAPVPLPAPSDPFAGLGGPPPAIDTDPAMAAAPPLDPFAGLGGAGTAVPPVEPLPPTLIVPGSSSAATLPPAGYTNAYTLWFSPQVLQYVAPVALVLIFFLQFSPWIGIYLGGVPIATQGAWGAAFGSIEPDRDVDERLTDVAIESSKELTDSISGSGFTILYLLLFVFVALPLTVGCLVYEIRPFPVPPQVEPFLKFRWGIATLVNLVAFFFLVLQLLVGFGLESLVAEKVEKAIAGMNAKTTAELKRADILRGVAAGGLSRTIWLRLVVVLHLLAIAAAGLVYCLEQRGNRPLPKIELHW